MNFRILTALILIVISNPRTCGAAATFVPEGKTAVFIGQNNESIENYIQKTKDVPDGFTLYTSIQEADGLDNWCKDYGSGVSNANEILNKYPGRAFQIGLYMVDALKEITEGKYDDNIEHIAQWIKSVNVPVFLRIGYEFDGPHNHYDPEDYKKAYIYIYNKLTKAGVTNVTYVWHSYASAVDLKIEAWYPGDNYVDWIAISYFDQPEDFMKPVVAFAKAKGKPLMIAEATPKDKRLKYELTWASWFRPFFRFVRNNDVRMICYINTDWESQPMWKGQHWGDTRVEEYPLIKEKWLEELKQDRYQFDWE